MDPTKNENDPPVCALQYGEKFYKTPVNNCWLICGPNRLPHADHVGTYVLHVFLYEPRGAFKGLYVQWKRSFAWAR